MVMMPLALEIKDRVDNVLEGFRAGDRPFLVDVADEKNRDRQILGQHEELPGDLADLRDGARGAFEFFRKNGLDRIDDDRPGLHLMDLVEDSLEAGFSQ